MAAVESWIHQCIVLNDKVVVVHSSMRLEDIFRYEGTIGLILDGRGRQERIFLLITFLLQCPSNRRNLDDFSSFLD